MRSICAHSQHTKTIHSESMEMSKHFRLVKPFAVIYLKWIGHSMLRLVFSPFLVCRFRFISVCKRVVIALVDDQDMTIFLHEPVFGHRLTHSVYADQAIRLFALIMFIEKPNGFGVVTINHFRSESLDNVLHCVIRTK